MITQPVYRAFGLAIPILCAATFLGILKAIFKLDASTNLFKTGITWGVVMGIACVLWAIAKKYNRI